MEIQGINFQPVDDEDDPSPTSGFLPFRPLVIPGNIGYLNQFFSVQIFTENAPADQSAGGQHPSPVILPPGPDRLPPRHNAPGDDPLRFARVGPDKVIQPVQPIKHPGGWFGEQKTTSASTAPGQTGSRVLVEGLQEGMSWI